MMGGIQAALIVSLRIAKARHVEWPLKLMAVLSAAFLAAGVLCHYWDIWTHRTVRGISFIFVFIDALGDLTSLVSVLFQPRLDIYGMVIYGVELFLWCGIFACGGYYNFRPWVKGKTSHENSSPPEAVGYVAPSPDVTQVIAIHDSPSSTSVFRTPSMDALNARARTAQRRSGDAIELDNRCKVTD